MTTEISHQKIRYLQSHLLKWIRRNKRRFPWREKSASPYQVLIAEIMLKKTSAKGIVDIYKKFIHKYPDLEKLSHARVNEIMKIVKPLGLYRSRSLLLKNMGRLYKRDRIIFKNREKLLEVKGLGQYIVNAFFVFGLGERYPVVDRNVLRIYRRYFGIPFRDDPRRDKNINSIAWKCLPLRSYKSFNYALLDLSNAICKPRAPKCEICPIRKKCNHKKEIFPS